MHKRPASSTSHTRKRRKGGTTYPVTRLDPPDKTVAEDVRIWDVSTSEKTGRVSASRRTIKHHHQALSEFEGPSASQQPKAGEEVDVEDFGMLVNSEPPKKVEECREKRRGGGSKENDSTRMEQWLQHRGVFLDEFLRLDGLGDTLDGPGLCPDCSKAPARFRCIDCFAGSIRCSSCIVSFHQNLPLHRLQMWSCGFFENTTLEKLGHVVDFGHSIDICPVNPETQLITVIDLSGHHLVRVRFCLCSQSSFLEPFRQLLRVRWYPASTLRPRTAFTFDLLDTYHKISLQGKLNLYDFYTTVMQKTDNCGHSDAKYRYHEMSRCVRQWRHLKDIKRGAAGHALVAVNNLGDGALAIECPACPHPGRNLPRDWEDASEDKAWFYSLFVAMDANFRLKLKSRGIQDPDLGSGLAYFVNTAKFEEHLKNHVGEDHIETCGTEFHAVNQANSRRSKDFSVSGVGALVCRHGLIRKNGVVDLQKGERFINMDYIFLSTIKDEKVKVIKLSYDIACRWSIRLRRRMLEYSEGLQFPEDKFKLEFFIPKFHLPAHGSSCHTKYSFNYRPGVGRTHGENIESGWAHTNPAAISTREMGAGARRSALDGHWGGWNWRKIVGFGPLLLKNLLEAVDMAKQCEDACTDFEKHRPADVIHEWKMAKLRWEKDPSQPDPFKLVEKASNFNAVKLKLSEMEASDAKSSNLAPHKLSPSSFVRMGLELEDQQHQITMSLTSKDQRTDLQKMEVQERRNVLARRINLWRTAQALYMPLVSGYLADEHDPPPSDDHELNESKPELWPLFLPSQLSEEDRASCHQRIVETERTLRLAQIQDELVDLRRLRRTLRNLRTYFRSNVIGEGNKAQTKSRTAESGVNDRIKRTVQRYRLAYAALLALDPTGDWTKDYFELTDKDNRGPGKEIEERGVGDGRYAMSWIWRGSTGAQDSTDHPEEVNETVRHEWMTCRARADRWNEESDLLQEEMRRVIVFLEWKSAWWAKKVGSRSGSIAADIQQGVDSYARKQSAIHHNLAVSLGNHWIPHLVTLKSDISWTKDYPWASGITNPPPVPSNSHKSPQPGNPPLSESALSNSRQDSITVPRSFDGGSEYETDDMDRLEPYWGHSDYDEGELSDGFGVGFGYS